MALVFDDITDRKNAEQHQAFLLHFSDALRTQPTADAVANRALQLLIEHLALDRSYIVTYQLDEDRAELDYQLGNERVPPLPEHFVLSDYPDAFNATREGTLVIDDDQEREGLSPAEQGNSQALGMRAMLAATLHKGARRSHWSMVALSASPRRWQPAEIRLVEEVAERTWSALERAKTDEALRQSEAEFRTLTQAAPALVWVCSAAGENIYFNQRWYDYTGQTTEEASGQGWTRTMHPEDAARILPYWQRCQQTGEAYEGEVRYRRHDGVYRWHLFRALPRRHPRGPIEAWYGLSVDTDDAKRAQQALHLSEARQRAIVESAKDYAIFTTDLARQVTSWNTGAQLLFGYTGAQILHQSADVLFTPEDRQQGAAESEAHQALSKGEAGNERWHIRRNGSRFYGSGVVTPLRDEQGSVIGLVKVMRDLTAQKRAEEALLEADRRKDEFLAMLAHELRNPMATLRSGLQILALTNGNDPTTGPTVGSDTLAASTLAMMNRQTDHLVRMVDDLLDVSRISQGKIELKKQPLNLVELVAQAAQSVGALYQQQGRVLRVDLPTAPIEVEGDGDRLSQVVTNLLTNGARYTGEQGQVWLTLEHRGQEAMLQVRDNGIGVAAHQLEAIFELFMQVDNSTARSKGGLGLGLTLVKRLVELHGGRVAVQSEGLGQGSTFTVHLPTSAPAAEPKAIPAPPVHEPSAGRRILVIDDNADAGFTLAMLLKLKDYETHTRTSGQAGIEAAEALQPAAILLDIGMPGLDGYETCRLLRQESWGQAIAVIALTGYGQEEDRQRTREAGFDGHLVKPVDLAALTNLLTDLLDKSKKRLV